MFSEPESKLLSGPDSGFPLLEAVKARGRACRKCGHADVNLHSMLRTVVNRYKNDAGFKAYCSRLFRLPCSVAGVLIEGKR